MTSIDHDPAPSAVSARDLEEVQRHVHRRVIRVLQSGRDPRIVNRPAGLLERAAGRLGFRPAALAPRPEAAFQPHEALTAAERAARLGGIELSIRARVGTGVRTSVEARRLLEAPSTVEALRTFHWAIDRDIEEYLAVRRGR